MFSDSKKVKQNSFNVVSELIKAALSNLSLSFLDKTPSMKVLYPLGLISLA